MSFIRVSVFLKKFINVILLFSILYLTFMKRFYLREVICQSFHTNQSNHAKTICNKTISTFNLIITVVMCFLLYVLVFKTAAHLVFNTPLRYMFKLIVFFSLGFNCGVLFRHGDVRLFCLPCRFDVHVLEPIRRVHD